MPTPERRTFSVAIFCRHQGQVLLVRHRRLGTWLPVGGELEPGETPLEAARRELREETGLEGHFPAGLGVDGTPPGLIGYEEHQAGSKGLHMNFAFLADVETRALQGCDEYDQVMWVGDPAPDGDGVDCPVNVRQLLRLALAAPPVSRPISNLRWYIAGLLCLSTELNYLDRQVLSVLATTIQKDLGLSTVDYSRITSAFLWSYMVMYAVGGRVVDFLGARRSLLLFVSGWSVANMLHALARTAGQLTFFRVLLGAAEPANFPAGIKAVSEWFPVRERALAVGIFNAGTAIGAAISAPLVSGIALWLGWRAAFVITGALGFVWVAAWALLYQSPARHPRLGEEERRLIADGAAADAAPPRTVPIWALLAMRETWGCILARALTDPVSYFLIFWIPKYLQDHRGFSLADIGFFGWIPFVALALGNVASGAIPRFLIARGMPLDRARKRTMLGISCLMPLLCLAVVRVQSPALALGCVTLLMFGHAAWGNVILPAEVFPREAVGTVTGFGGCAGAFVGAITQLVIGGVVQAFSFTPIFVTISVVYLIAFAGVARWIPELGRIRTVPAPA